LESPQIYIPPQDPRREYAVELTNPRRPNNQKKKGTYDDALRQTIQLVQLGKIKYTRRSQEEELSLEKLADDYQKEVKRFFDLHAELLNAINRTGRATRFKFRRVLRMLFNQYKGELYDDVQENEAKHNKIIEDYIKECKDYHDKDIINDAKLAFKDAVAEMMTGQWIVNVI
jgi:hypothetical protein